MDTEIGMVGITEAGILLDTLAARALAVATVAWPLIVEDFQRIELERFANAGPGWAQLSPNTIAIKGRRGYVDPGTIMVATYDLMESLGGDNQYTVRELGPDVLLMGTNAPYAQYHQEGPREIKVFGRGRATLPQRTLVDVTEEDAARWAEVISAAMMTGERLAL